MSEAPDLRMIDCDPKTIAIEDIDVSQGEL